MPKKREPYTLLNRNGTWFFGYYDKHGKRRIKTTGETSKAAAIETARVFLKSQEGDMLVSVKPPPHPNYAL